MRITYKYIQSFSAVLGNAERLAEIKVMTERKFKGEGEKSRRSISGSKKPGKENVVV